MGGGDVEVGGAVVVGEVVLVDLAGEVDAVNQPGGVGDLFDFAGKRPAAEHEQTEFGALTGGVDEGADQVFDAVEGCPVAGGEEDEGGFVPAFAGADRKLLIVDC